MDFGVSIRNPQAVGRSLVAALAILVLLPAVPVFAVNSIEGQVLGAGAPIAKSTVTLWSASADAQKQLAQTQTGDDGRFTLSAGRIAGQQPVPGRNRRRTGRQPGGRQQPGDRAPRGARQQAAGTRRHQRIYDRGIGMDQRAVPRRRRAQR